MTKPSADQAWQFWANNELTQSATFPSMFSKVHKNELSMIGCKLGNSPSDTWKVPTSESRARDLDKLNVFWDTIDMNLPQEKILFANRQRPEALPLKINKKPKRFENSQLLRKT